VAACSSGNTDWYDTHSDPAKARQAYSERASSLLGSKPNIVVILADDLGFYDAFRQDPFYETPHLDRLAAQGLVFDRAYSSGPNCAPSRASLMTGMTTPRHHIYTPNGGSKIAVQEAPLWVPMNPRFLKRSGVTPRDYAAQYEQDDLRLFESTDALDDPVSIADALASAGYRTARLGKWHLGPNNLGFDMSSSDGLDEDEGGSGGRKGHYNNPDVARTLTDAAVEFIKQPSQRPFFLYLSHWDPHFPWVANADVAAKYAAKRSAASSFAQYDENYAAMVEAIDTSTGRIMAALEVAGISDNTLVVFASDNGGTFITPQRELRSIKGSLYEGGIKVATIAHWPGVIAAGSHSPSVISSVDFFPTFSDLAGVELQGLRKPQYQVLDGRSLVPVLAGDTVTQRPVFFHFPLYLGSDRKDDGPAPGFRAIPASAVVLDRWKLIEYFEPGADDEGPEVTSRFELYDLAADPGESLNLATGSTAEDTEARQVLRQLQDLLADWRTRTQAPVPERRNKFYGVTADAKGAGN
jgi:arylsulfatase A-like enzyme